MDEQIRNLIFQAIDQTIADDDFERLQDAIEEDAEVCNEYLLAVGLSEALAERASENAPLTASEPGSLASGWDLRSPKLLTAVAAILVLACGAAFWFGQRTSSDSGATIVDSATNIDATESLIAGHATLRRSVDLRWPDNAVTYREGDVLPDGLLQFDDGVAEIDFFCGATLIVEGPAELDIESDWSLRLIKGRLRANVPPAARGFIVKAADAEVIDLGTEFALEVASGNARVEVIDGEVELRGGEHDGDHLTTGQQQSLKGTAQPDTFDGLSTLVDVRRRREDAAARRFAEWAESSRQLSTDDRLIAYYPIAATQTERAVPNAAGAGGILRDGLLVGPVDRTSGRFGSQSAGLEFDRPGARVRTRIDGEFQAFTFACWVRIDSLEHRYNALFMSDSYENGEPHWQIRDDGCLMFSVMVDDTVNVPRFDETDQRVVKTAGRHHIYYTESFWDMSKSGQWFHLAAVYDSVGRHVAQFVNGRQLSSEVIAETFHIRTLKIGAAEIGNWGQPLRNSPWFAVRNLNGTIDELAIFDGVLGSEEIQLLYEQGKPLGY